MRVDDFDFDLDPSLIAEHPAQPRDAARLLLVPAQPAPLADHHVRDLPDLLRPGDAMVVNDTRVIAAALTGVRRREAGEARISVNLLEKQDGEGYWSVLARPAKRLRPGDRIVFRPALTSDADPEAELGATVEDRGEGGLATLRFDLSGGALDRAIEVVGDAPLPPYITAKRGPEPSDRDDYQTIFAQERGAVAAPTAGLHFTDELMDRLAARGVAVHRITLHVGAGTFLPVKADDTDDHVMHAEWGRIDAGTAEALNTVRGRGGSLVAVGTTCLRLLETAVTEDGTIQPFADETDIFITPGYRFRAVDRLMTNFHLPRSTLFMLVSAFSGLDRMRAAYAHAIAQRYRFYSFGDACLLDRVG